MSVILLFQGSEIVFQSSPSTFPELVAEIAERLNLTSDDDIARIGRQVNRRYKRITTAIGLQTTRRRQLHADTSQGVSTLVFSPAEKLINVIDKSVSKHRVLDEVSIEELRAIEPYSTAKPTKYAIIAQTATSITIEFNCIPQTEFTLYADVHSSISELSGTRVPLIPDSFHDTLLWGTLADEYLKLEKVNLNTKCEDQYTERLSDLKYFVAKSAMQDIFQGKVTSTQPTAGSSSGSGSVPNGAASYTQTGQIIFDRSGASNAAPFVVVSGAAKVDNLNADKLDGLDSTDFAITADLAFYTSLATFNAHHTRHELGGADAIKLDDLSTPDDNTDLNASISKHGLMKKLSNSATDFFDGSGNFDTVKDSDLSTSDITTNDVTIAKHGLTPKAPNDTTKFLRGDASWAVVQAIDTYITSTAVGATNNWAPGLINNTVIFWNGASAITVTGFAGGVAGQRITFKNVSATQIASFSHNSGSSSAGNKLKNLLTSVDTTVGVGGSIVYEQDGTDWQLISHIQSVGQIPFPASQNASTDVNTLDDYKEGTWVPVLGGDGGTSGQTYSSQYGYYVKIGKMVFANFVLALSAKGTITGNVSILGLPAGGVENTAGMSFPVVIGYFQGLNTNWIHLAGNADQGNTFITIRGNQAAAVSNSTTLATGDLTNTSVMVGMITYRASA